MTLVIGTVCANGVFFCSDTEETTALGNKSVSKMRYVGDETWHMALAAAGFGPLCDKAMDWIAAASQDAGAAFVSSRECVVEREMKRLYAEYIDSVPDYRSSERPIQVVIGLIDKATRRACLYRTCEDILQSVSDRNYACAGCGEGLANYYLERLFQDFRPPLFSGRLPQVREAETLLRFVMKEAKESVGYVGGNTDTMSLYFDPREGWGKGTFAAGWEGQQPRLDELIDHFWLDDPNPKQ